jgi:hypothetical protein
LARQYDHKGTINCLEEHIQKTRIKQAQDSLRRMMESPEFNSVELYKEYIEHCTTGTVLAFSAFGMAYLGNDDKLPNTFLVKTIQLAKSDQATIDDL